MKSINDRYADRIFSLASVGTSFFIILFYFEVIAASPYQFTQKFIGAPLNVYNHIFHGTNVQLHSYTLLFTLIALSLTIISLLKPGKELTKYHSIFETLTISFLFTSALVIVRYLTLRNFYVLFVLLITPLFYIIFRGYRKRFGKENLLQVFNIGRKELGISKEMGVSALIITALTILGIGLLYWNIIQPKENISQYWIFHAILIFPFCEEWFYRMFVLNRIDERLKYSLRPVLKEAITVGILFSSFWFTFGHLDFLYKLYLLEFDYDFFRLFFTRFIGGLLLGLAYLYQKNEIMGKNRKVENQLWIPIAWHGLWNFLVTFFGGEFAIGVIVAIYIFISYIFQKKKQ